MSQESVELVRRLYEAQGGPELDAVTEAVCDPDIEWRASEGFGVINGRTALLRTFEDFSATFEDWRVVAEELIDAGDQVVGVTHGHGHGKASGAVVDAHYAIVFTVHANRIVRAREYATRAEALKAVGLDG
jgi:ketosteroid isomerase-like protein